MSRAISHRLRLLGIRPMLALVLGAVLVLAFVTSAATALLINGFLPPNFAIVVLATTVVASLPPVLYAVATIRRLQYSRDRLEAIGDDLSDRVAELDAAAAQLEEARATLETSVARRTRELEAARSVAEEANSAKSAFLAQMSHEFRTPLNAIIGFAEMMFEPRFLSRDNRMEHVEEYAGIIHHSGRHLLALVGDLLDLSKIEAGKLDLKIERLDPAALVSDVESIMGPQLREKDQKLISLLDPGGGALEGDHRVVIQMLLNLVSNAVKYSPPGKTILLSVTGADGHLAFTVRDEGQGMTPIEIRQAMEPFTRLSTAETARESGSGLGLYIVGALVETLGGTLTITSEPDKGTEARIVLPHRVAVNPPKRRPARRERFEVA